MALTAAQLKAAHRWLGQKMFVEPKVTANQNTDDLKAAAIAVETWIVANQASLNAVIPEPMQSATADQKSLLFAAVVLARKDLV